MPLVIEREKSVVPAYQRLQDGMQNFFDGKPGRQSFSLEPERHGNIHVSFGFASGIVGYFPDKIEIKWEPRDPDIFSVALMGRSGGSVVVQSCGESVGVFRTGDALDRNVDEKHIKRRASVDVLVDLCVTAMQKEKEAKQAESVVQ